MSIELYSALLCEKVITDINGVNSYIQTYESIKTPSLPFSTPPCVVASRFVSEIDFEFVYLRILLLSRSGKRKKLTPEFRIAPFRKAQNVNINLPKIDFEEAEMHTISIEIKTNGDWKEVGKIPFTVKLEEPTPTHFIPS